MKTKLSRVNVWSNVRMVTLQGALVPTEGNPTLLEGGTDSLAHRICCVKLNDGREFLIAREHLEEAAPDTEREPVAA